LQELRQSAEAFRRADPDNLAAGIFYLTRYLQERPHFHTRARFEQP
jgi:hypothetical protein